MKKTEEQRPNESRRIKPWTLGIALLVNVLAFVCIGAVYLQYSNDASQRLFDENINNVNSLNEASANAAYTYTGSMGIKIDDTASYIRANDLDYEQAVKYLEQTNTDPDRQLQLVLSGSYGSTGELSFGDYSGVSVRTMARADGSLGTVRSDIVYGSGYYDILRCFTDTEDKNLHGLCFTPEFTDPDTKLKCFGVYRHVVLSSESGQRRLYTMLLAINSLTALDAYNMQNEYQGQSTVLIDEDGDYIIKNNDYRNANFYDYIVNYNGLTLDNKAKLLQQVRDAVAVDGNSANLYYKNHKGEDCVFSVAVMPSGWYSVTCVPMASFSEAGYSVNYSLVIVLLFLALFIFDGIAIYLVGRLMNHNVAVAQRAQEEADQANRAKSRFLSTMSHELRTPLNAIIGLSSLSVDSIEDPPVLRDYLKKIDISSKLLLQLISDILDVSAIESNKLRLNTGEFDLTKLISSLSAIYYDQCAAKGIEFGVVIKELHSEVLIGDSVRVNQVLLNFLSNAVKFTPSGGKVTLRAEQVRREGDMVYIRFDVSDTGCGISDELSSRLFKPFERAAGEAARKYSGTGLGLSIAKNLAELMGGQIGVESQEGVGSSFWAELPFRLPEASANRSFSPIKDLRVLAAIGNGDERQYIGRILESFGAEYSLADTAAGALELLAEGKREERPFDLCLLDWKMTDLTALDAAQLMREAFDRNSLTITVLAYDLAEAKPRCIQAGADYVLGKPVFPSVLYDFLEEISSGQVRMIPDAARSFDMSGKRVLLVEDNQTNQMIARLLLAKVGLEVETANNGQLGCERFAASPPGYFAAVLMDVQMPVMDGYQATETIRASSHPQAKTVPILAMTADAFSEDVEKARRAGMNEHLAKPIVPEMLYATLAEYIG